MDRSRRAWLLIPVTLLGLAAWALTTFVPPARAQTLEEKVKSFELPNGMKFLVVERREAPVALCAIVFNVGSSNEGANTTGISHLIEHMMFKGTEMMGTKDYKKEIPYLKETDDLGEKTIRLRQEIGEWRFARFRGLTRSVISSFSDDEKTRVGADKNKQTLLVVEKIRAMAPLPDSLTSVPNLIQDANKNYLDLFLQHELAWGEISRLLDEQRRYIKKDELWETYMNNGSRFLNAFTSNDATVYFSYIPSNRLELFMDMESDRMEYPVFREFWSERDVVMEERRLGENDPDQQLEESFLAVAFTASPYRWPVVGWMSDLQGISRADIEKYHKTYYAPNNALLMIAGDVDTERLKSLAGKYFGPILRQTPPPTVKTREPEQKGERRIVIEHTANPKLLIGWHRPVYPDPDDAALSVLESILGQGRTSRLYKTVFEEKELTASEPNVSDAPGSRFDNILQIEAAPRNPHTLDEVEKAILDQVELLKKEPVSDRELTRIKNQIDAQNIRNVASNIGIAFQVAFGQIYYGDYHAMFRQQERIKQVTAEDVMRVANKYLTPANRTVAYRVQIEDKTKEPGAKEEEEIDQQAIMQYVQTLPKEEQMELIKKFQQFRSEEEAKPFIQELWKRVQAARSKKEGK
jgi:predicted Zn-dependent peptidase